MSLEARLNRLELATGARNEDGYCACPVITRAIGVHGSDFYAKHEPCGKPIDPEAVRNPAIFETRVLLPFYEKPEGVTDADYSAIMAARYEERTRPPSSGLRLFIHDFSGQDPDAAAQAEAAASGRRMKGNKSNT